MGGRGGLVREESATDDHDMMLRQIRASEMVKPRTLWLAPFRVPSLFSSVPPPHTHTGTISVIPWPLGPPTRCHVTHVTYQ